MDDGLIEVATSPCRWNGVAVSQDGRIFVSMPRWTSDDTISVGEILADGSIRAFPGGDWNTWHPERSPESPGSRFVSVNAAFTDSAGDLWVVDLGTLGFGADATVVPDGPKLVQFDPVARNVRQVYGLGEEIAPQGSYLNDVRVGRHHAYLTELGKGAIIVIELRSGAARRVLEGHEFDDGPSPHRACRRGQGPGRRGGQPCPVQG